MARKSSYHWFPHVPSMHNIYATSRMSQCFVHKSKLFTATLPWDRTPLTFKQDHSFASSYVKKCFIVLRWQRFPTTMSNKTPFSLLKMATIKGRLHALLSKKSQNELAQTRACSEQSQIKSRWPVVENLAACDVMISAGYVHGTWGKSLPPLDENKEKDLRFGRHTLLK